MRISDGNWIPNSNWICVFRLIIDSQTNSMNPEELFGFDVFDSKLRRWFLHSSIPEELSIPRRILQFMYNTIFKSNFCKWKTAISHIFIVFSRFVGVCCCSGGCQSIDEDTVEVKPRASKEVTGTCYLKHLQPTPASHQNLKPSPKFRFGQNRLLNHLLNSLLNHLLKSSPKVS